MLRFVPDGVAHLPVAGVAAQRLRVDALHRVWAIHTPGIQICFIIPAFILPEPDDPPLVRSFFCPAEHGKAVSPVVRNCQQLNPVLQTAAHFLSEITLYAAHVVAIDHRLVKCRAGHSHQAGKQEDPVARHMVHGGLLSKNRARDFKRY